MHFLGVVVQRLRVLLKKELKNSDVGSLGRIVLPKVRVLLLCLALFVLFLFLMTLRASLWFFFFLLLALFSFFVRKEMQVEEKKHQVKGTNQYLFFDFALIDHCKT